MTEPFALDYTRTRQQQLGAASYDLNYKHLTLNGAEILQFQAQGQMWLVVSAEPGILISSDQGRYYPKSGTLQLQQHEHSGALTVQNNGFGRAQVVFIVVTWRYPGADAPPAAPVSKPPGT